MIVVIKEAGKAFRLQRTFKNETYVILQVRQSFNLIISHDQGGAQNGITSLTNPNIPPDGLLFTNGTTAPSTGIPFDTFWQGELWYAGDVAGAQFSIEMGTETSQRRD